jgi:hypothetical protein
LTLVLPGYGSQLQIVRDVKAIIGSIGHQKISGKTQRAKRKLLYNEPMEGFLELRVKRISQLIKRESSRLKVLTLYMSRMQKWRINLKCMMGYSVLLQLIS